jgi:hypothetical protein
LGAVARAPPRDGLEQRQQLLSDPTVPEEVRGDLQLLVTVGMLWGEDALKRFEFAPARHQDTSKIGMLLQPFRH